MKKPWSKIKRGDVLDLGGREWTVEKIKPGKKRAEVKIRHKGNVVRDTVKLADKVRIATRPPRGGSGVSRPSKPKPQQTTPPKRAEGDPWETQQDRIEKKLDEILGARLIGEATDTDAGYYVPPVDTSTVAAHLVIYHGTDVTDLDEVGMLKVHEEQHEEHLAGAAVFPVNHWHTEKRPTSKKKAKK